MTTFAALLDLAVRAGFATLAWTLAGAAALALYAAWLAVDMLRHRRNAVRATARIAAVFAAGIHHHRPAPTAPAANKDNDQ